MSNVAKGPYHFFVPGPPKAKQSFKVAKKGNTIKGYTDEAVKAWQEAVGWECKRHWTQDPIESEPFRVHIEFYLATDRKIDLDNLSKAVLDGLNEIIWMDDKQIYELYLTKILVTNKEDEGARVEWWVLTEKPRG